jgi:transcriptional regulator with XRE-family HTH domain
MRYRPSFKEPRLKAGLTQQEVAVRLGRTQPAIQKWESGENSPTMADLCRLAELYDAAPSAFFREADFVASVGDLRIVIQCKRHTGIDTPEARKRLSRQLNECSAALSAVPQGFATHWLAGLKACASLVTHEIPSPREQASRPIDSAIDGANGDTPPTGARRLSEPRRPVVPAGRTP